MGRRKEDLGKSASQMQGRLGAFARLDLLEVERGGGRAGDGIKDSELERGEERLRGHEAVGDGVDVDVRRSRR
eukprot:scaffold4767_cov30-Tisochrysis_lutea.AAC.2